MGKNDPSYRKLGYRRGRRVVALGLWLAATAAGLPAADLRVQGLGRLDNRAAQQTLRLLLGPQAEGAIDANGIEDAVLVLFSDLNEQGYLAPTLTVEVTLADGRTVRHELDAKLEKALPRPLAATAVVFRLRPGTRFVLDKVTFTGSPGVGRGILRGAAGKGEFERDERHRVILDEPGFDAALRHDLLHRRGTRPEGGFGDYGHDQFRYLRCLRIIRKKNSAVGAPHARA